MRWIEENRDRIIAIALLLLLLFIVASCGICHKCEYRNLQTDSIYVERVDSVFVRDTILQVQIRDSIVYQTSDIDSLSHLETDVATSDAWVEDGELHHRLENKRELIPINVQIPMAISREKHYIRQIVHNRVNYVTEIQSFWIVCGKIFAICIGVFMLALFIRLRRR